MTMMGMSSCPDGHHCDNGSLCVENPEDEGSYYCDCEESSLNDTVAGLSCEHVATDYCTFAKEVSAVSFCTNHGTCKAEVSPESAHLGCICPDEYVGDHCQFVKGTPIPDNWPGQSPNVSTASGNSNVKGGVTAAIVLICLGCVGVLAFLVYTRKKSLGGVGLRSPEILELDADGDVLKEAMSSRNGSGKFSSARPEQEMSSRNGSGKLSTAEFELEADGDVLKQAIALSPDKAANFDDVNISSPDNAPDDEDKDLV